MDDRSRSCILRVDEVYVKQSASYCGREMFDFATDNPEKKSKNFAKDHGKIFFGRRKIHYETYSLLSAELRIYARLCR